MTSKATRNSTAAGYLRVDRSAGKPANGGYGPGPTVPTTRVRTDIAPQREGSMAAKDTGGQKRATKTSEETDEVSTDEAADLSERKDKLDSDIDAILDEIDEALEENSEEFVRGFIQKGGQ
jgi:ubiquitin-like protein Pup